MDNVIHVVGGGTVDRVRQNLAVASVSYGETARRVASILREKWPEIGTKLHLTRMACGGESQIETLEDVRSLLKSLVQTNSTRAIFLSAALCQFQAGILERAVPVGGAPDAGEISPRMGQHLMVLSPREEIIDYVRAYRRDLVFVGFTTAAGLHPSELVEAAILYARLHMCSLVVIKDRVEKRWALANQESGLNISNNRDDVLVDAVLRAKSMCEAESGPDVAQVPDSTSYEAQL